MIAFLLRAAVRPTSLLLSALFILLGGGTAALAALQVRYADRVYPGVRLQGTDVSGKTAEEVFRIAQAKAIAFGAPPRMTLRFGDQALVVRTADLGLHLDPAATTQRVLTIGRVGDLAQRLRTQVETWWNGVDVAPVVELDDRSAERLIALLASETAQEPRDAAVVFENGTVRQLAPRAGRALDVGRALQLVRAAMTTGKPAELSLPQTHQPPRIDQAAAEAAAAMVQRIISRDLVVWLPRWDENDQALAPAEAIRIRGAEMLNYLSVREEADDAQLAIHLERDRFRPLVEPLAAAVNQAPQNARFEYEDGTGSLRAIWPGRLARALDVEATLDAIEAAWQADVGESPAMDVTAVVRVTEPPVPATATAQQLGITGLITQATTYFKGSSAPRLANIKVAASRFHGVVIPPGATFSFNQYLGDVSTREGFEEGLIIVGDRTIKGVGGGVCQVSTTAYQAALRAGFPIIERYPHGYRVSYYERGMGAGFDAAVFSPLVDLKFVNDSPGHLLIETYYDQARATLTFKFYGTPDGRQVTISEPQISKVVPHGPDIYEPDPEGKVPEGKAKQVEFAVDGATIVFRRIVTRNSQTLIDERVVSQYAPWQARYQYGPGFTPPEGAEVHSNP